MNADLAPGLDALVVALAAGALSCLSPCVFPLLPGYVAFIAGTSDRAGTVARTAAFVIGFAAVFTALGASASAAGAAFGENRATLELVAGFVVAAMGLWLLWGLPMGAGAGVLTRIHQPGSVVGAVGVGAAFAVAWTPCIGPFLGAMLTFAASEGEPVWGAVLLLTYSLGMAAPLVLVSLGAGAALRRWVAGKLRAAQVVAGITMVAVGLLIASGRMYDLAARVARVVPV